MADESEFVDSGDEVVKIDLQDEVIGASLTPRQRRVAQLIAAGQMLKTIAEQTGFTYQTIRAYSQNSVVKAEVRRFQDKLFELSAKESLKDFKGKALENIHWILNDDTGRVNVAQKADMSKWLVEQLEGKAIQKHDLSENALASFMDQLDNLRQLSKASPEAIDVTPLQIVEKTPEQQEEDEMKNWVDSL